MKIIRDGKEIELTEEELFSAFKEQERLFDFQIIKDNMKDNLTESEYDSLKRNEKFIEEAADTLRINQDKYGMSFEEALHFTFKKTKLRYSACIEV